MSVRPAPPRDPLVAPPAPVDPQSAARYVTFSRDDWARLRDSTPLTITETELVDLRGVNELVSLSEVEQIYLPLTRLINLYVAATQRLHTATDTFLGRPAGRVPYVIGIAGSVAVGKSTAARILKALLAGWPDHPRVDLVATDGFLFPNAVLESRGLLARKGFPESYDVRRLLDFLIDLKSGRSSVEAPAYSHLTYDIVPDRVLAVERPDILILEGLNVLQSGSLHPGRPQLFVSDFFDFSIYIDADHADVERWYVERFLTLRETVFTDRASYFHRYASLTDEEARETARRIWLSINYENLKENIEPTRERAHLILSKGTDHEVRQIRLRKL